MACAILAFLPEGAYAQQTSELVSAKLTTLSWENNIKNLWYQAKDGPRSMEAYSRGLTTPVAYTGPGVIRFHPDAETLALPPEVRPAPIATATLPATGGELLLVFTPAGNDKPGWDVRVIGNSTDDFPLGAYRFFNFTPNTLRVALDKTVESVGSFSSFIVRPAGGEPVRDISVMTALGNKIIYSSIWGHEEKRRANVFILPDPQGRNGISVRQFYQSEMTGNPRK